MTLPLKTTIANAHRLAQRRYVTAKLWLMKDDRCGLQLRPVSGSFLGLSLLCGLAAAIVFTAFPDLDIVVSSLFYTTEKGFSFQQLPLAQFWREAFKGLFIAFSILCLAGLILTAVKRLRLFRLDFSHWLYLVLCLLIGPGLVTNTLLKDQWGRARPVKIERFGGQMKYTRALIPSTSCARNCSFVSGESSSHFMIFFALSLLLANARTRLILAGFIMGGLSGLIRIGMGGHFLSDVIFSGVFMAVLAYALFQIMSAPPVQIRLLQMQKRAHRRFSHKNN